MLTSLFGELGPPERDARKSDEGAGRFAASALLESVATEVNDSGQIVDRHSRELVVTGSPAQAIRAHFASTRADLDTASRMITVLDPMGVWASAVIKALSDAGGQPVERLHLRDHATLRTLATIERTTLVRRHEDPLRIVHAEVRAPGSENAEIPVALMERSHLTTVVVGPMQPHAVDALLQSLRQAAGLATWRCPTLLFMLPPNALWIANKVAATVWPQPLAVHVLTEPMTSASAVWNAMLGMWNQVKSQPPWGSEESGSSVWAEAEGAAATTAPPVMRVSRPVLDAATARQALAEMLQLDGLIGCGVVDAGTGLLIAREVMPDTTLDFELAAASAAQVLRGQRQAARDAGLDDPIDEVVTTAGRRLQILRPITGHHEIFLLALLDRQATNLALARFRVADVERHLQ